MGPGESPRGGGGEEEGDGSSSGSCPRSTCGLVTVDEGHEQKATLARFPMARRLQRGSPINQAMGEGFESSDVKTQVLSPSLDSFSSLPVMAALALVVLIFTMFGGSGKLEFTALICLCSSLDVSSWWR